MTSAEAIEALENFEYKVEQLEEKEILREWILNSKNIMRHLIKPIQPWKMSM